MKGIPEAQKIVNDLAKEKLSYESIAKDEEKHLTQKKTQKLIELESEVAKLLREYAKKKELTIEKMEEL